MFLVMKFCLLLLFLLKETYGRLADSVVCLIIFWQVVCGNGNLIVLFLANESTKKSSSCSILWIQVVLSFLAVNVIKIKVNHDYVKLLTEKRDE